MVIDGDFKMYNPVGTNSMLPLVGKGNHAFSYDYHGQDLFVGDIIAFNVSWYDAEEYDVPVMHRIIDIAEDDEGIYYTTMGDNNNAVDPWKLRDEHVLSIIAGVIY